jgi:ParB-like chromosome segregation protein Spo0J
MKPSFAYVSLAEIDAVDFFFQLQPVSDDPRLTASAAKIGIIQPLWLQRRAKGGFRLVSGFRRFRAAAAAGLDQAPALLLPAEWNDLEAYRWMVQEKSSLRPLTPLETSYASATLRHAFNLDAIEIIRNWFPLMGLASNPKLFSLCAPLCMLEPELQTAIAADELSIEIASTMSAEPAEERLLFWHLNELLRMGKNRQREFWQLIQDVRKIKKHSLQQLLQDPGCAALLDNPNLTPSQKSDRFKTLLMQWRYPEYSATLARFEALIHTAKLPPDLHLRPTPWFSGEEFILDFSFTTVSGFDTRLKVLQELLKRGLIAKLVQLT